MVSKKKNRYVTEDFDLDLTFVLPNIIAMGYPSIGFEGYYRNSMKDVQEFFNKKFFNCYKIYNLCSEKVYAQDSFQKVD